MVYIAPIYFYRHSIRMSSTGNKEKNPFTNYAKNSSFEGLRKVLIGESIVRRVAWLVVLLVCVAAVGYALRNNFKIS